MISNEKDSYETPNDIIDIILQYISKETRLYDPFYCNGSSGDRMRSRGYSCIHEDKNFYEDRPSKQDYDIIVSNPPFSDLKNVFTTLQQLNKPFALLLPIEAIARKYFIFDQNVQLVVIKKNVHFIKDGKRMNRPMRNMLAWVCVDMGLDKDIIFED
jgi:hypothetical protein